HMPVHMDDMVVGQDQPHMVDDPIGIVKKGQVPGFALLDETQGLSLFGLPKGCPLKGMAVDFVYHIYKAGTIDPEGAFASCQVGGHQILKGSVHQVDLWSDPLDSDPFKAVAQKGGGAHYRAKGDREQYPLGGTDMGK